ncbi:MAG: nitrous oxide reductase family maturation protein NosD [Candidatus Hodarchaeota archaeon]
MKRIYLKQLKLLLIGVIILQPILFPGVTGWVITQELQINTRNQFSSPILSRVSIQFEEHSPILIDGNANFTTQVNAENWPGEGTPTAPYFIDAVNITEFGNNNLIDIRNTNVHFRISNCLLTQGSYGISLSNVTNGQISNNIVTNNSFKYGIRLYRSDNNTLTNNTVANNSDIGISFEESDKNTLTNNTVTNNYGFGVYLHLSRKCTIANNNITNTGYWGILLHFSGNNTLTNNTISNNNRYGISLESSEGNTLTNNTISNNHEGIYLSDSGYNIILRNILINSGFIISGSLLEDLLQAKVANNSVDDKPLVFWQNITDKTVPNDAGQVILVKSSSVEVTGQNLVGIQGVYCCDLHIHNNSVSNDRYGISLEYSENCTLACNTVTTNSRTGISLSYSRNNTLINNNVTNNSRHGISLEHSENCTLTSNIITDNVDSGILFNWDHSSRDR